MERGRLELILGPMFSGKSTELQRRLRRHQLAGASTLVIKFSGDTRYDSVAGAQAVVTHDGRAASAHATTTLADVYHLVKSVSVVGIDEGQFFDDVALAESWASAGKTVIVAGLDATFERTPFLSLLNLVSRAESVTKLTAVCSHCGADASFTHRKLPTVSGASLIGGAEAYEAMCRQCHAAANLPAPVVTPAVPAAVLQPRSALASPSKKARSTITVSGLNELR
jgi:thymidine kinase